TIGAGVYFIGATWNNFSDAMIFNGDPGTLSTMAGVTYNSSAFVAGGSLADPTSLSGTPGYFGPNFTATGAPEPMTWALMLVGFGGMGAALRSRRRVALAA